MNVDHLKAFHKVAATGSFTKAARELFLTQSAVSQQISALENEIGGKLFDRSGRKILLTGEGEVLLSYAERLFDLHEEIETLFGGLRTLRKGKVAVGATAVIGTYFMPTVNSTYHRQYPGIEIDLRMGNSEQVLRMILDREVDMGIAGLIKKDPALHNVFLHRERLMFVCSPRNPLASRESVSIRELERIPFIWREKGTQTLELVQRWFREKAGGDYPRQGLSLANMEAAKRVVEEGYGVTIVPETASRREIEAGLLTRLDVVEFDVTVDYGLFYRRGRIFNRVAESFLESLCGLGIFSHGENLRSLLGKRHKNAP